MPNICIKCKYEIGYTKHSWLDHGKLDWYWLKSWQDPWTNICSVCLLDHVELCWYWFRSLLDPGRVLAHILAASWEIGLVFAQIVAGPQETQASI